MLGEEGRVKLRDAILGNVSVVSIPLAACSQSLWEFPMVWESFGMFLMILSIGSLVSVRRPFSQVDMNVVYRCPPMPVCITIALSDPSSSGMHLPAALLMALESSSPSSPVRRLAHHEFATTLLKPRPFVFFKSSLVTVMEGAWNSF